MSATSPSVKMLAMFVLVCLLYTSDAADERSSVDLGGRRIIKKKKDANSAQHTIHSKIIDIENAQVEAVCITNIEGHST